MRVTPIEPGTCGERYRRTYRRLLIDMQIPDWDERLLRAFDPLALVRASVAAEAAAIMVYFQSHTGLCNWPTSSGRQHRALTDRDVMAEFVTEAHAHRLPVCGYYSVNFNNWAYLEQPSWRLIPAVPAVIAGGALQRERYGLCCPNSPGYRSFVLAQAQEIAGRYEVDALFFDMMWWMSICVCDHCRRQFRAETGHEIPDTVNWFDPNWCEFQAARERWIVDLACELRAASQASRSGIAVYHNFANCLSNWTRGVSFASASGHDFLGGDFYGGGDEQLVVSKLMRDLSATQPVEFMTTVTGGLAEHERLKPAGLLQGQTLAATASGAAFLGIIPIDPDGRWNQSAFDLLKTAFDRMKSFEPHIGGQPVEDIAVYFSDASKMSFTDNGLRLEQAPVNAPECYPHLRAVHGMCRVLQQAHLPFGVITRRQLDALDRYSLVVLPNVLRMDEEELTAVREYVHRGGRIYASRYTSLTSTDGDRKADFALADVFGCHFDGVESGRNFYLEPSSQLCAAAILPERALSHWSSEDDQTGAVRLADQTEGRRLMTLTLPAGYPSRGSVDGADWSSIHSFPPWQRLDVPTIVEHEFGSGRAVYSAADLEAGGTDSHDALLLALVRSLCGASHSFSSNAHPCVWMTVFDQPDKSRWIVCFLNNSRERPTAPLFDFEFRLLPRPGRRFVRLRNLPDLAEPGYLITDEGCLVGKIPRLDVFLMCAAEYAQAAA